MRIYVIQNLYNLADMAAKNEIIDSRAFSGFCGVDSQLKMVFALANLFLADTRYGLLA